MHLKKTQSRTGLVATALTFLGSWDFFLFAYPYHQVRREQQNLFLFDGDYIRQTYRGVGWLARFVSDFLEQFFVSPVPASLIVALLLTGIGVVVYRICRHFLKEWPSLGIAALFFVWSFLRECGNLYITRYTVVTLAYLSLVLLALQCRKAWQKPVAAAVLLALGFWALESPFHKHYGKLWSVPKFDYERVIGLDVETSLENWDKVLQLSKVDLYMEEASYCYNLAPGLVGAHHFHERHGRGGMVPAGRHDAGGTEFHHIAAGLAQAHRSAFPGPPGPGEPDFGRGRRGDEIPKSARPVAVLRKMGPEHDARPSG